MWCDNCALLGPLRRPPYRVRTVMRPVRGCGFFLQGARGWAPPGGFPAHGGNARGLGGRPRGGVDGASETSHRWKWQGLLGRGERTRARFIGGDLPAKVRGVESKQEATPRVCVGAVSPYEEHAAELMSASLSPECSYFVKECSILQGNATRACCTVCRFE